MQSDETSPERPHRRPGRPRKNESKPRGKDTARISPSLLKRVKRYQKKERSQTGRSRSIAEILTSAFDVFESVERPPELSALLTEERRLLRIIIRFLETAHARAKADVLSGLTLVVRYIALFKRKV